MSVRRFSSLWFLLFLALLLRLGAGVYWEHRAGGRFFFGDSQTYWDLGRTIAHGEPYRIGAEKEFAVFRMPGYPVLLAPLFLVFGNEPPIFAARFISILFGVATVGAVWRLARRLCPARPLVATLAAGYVAVAPLQVVSSVLVLSESPFGLCLVWQLDCWTRLLQTGRGGRERNIVRKSLVYAILLGIASAACVFLRPSWLYFLPFAIGVHCLLIVATARKNDLVTKTRAARTRRAIKGCLLAVLVFAVCMAPWWIRNYAATGRFVATTLQLGASLYDGWRPDADGASDMRFVESFRASESPDSPTYEYDVDTRMKRASLDWARAHPGRVLSLAGVKFVRLWNPRPNEPSFRAVGVQATVFCSTVPLLVFGLIGIVRTLRLGSSFGRMEYVLLWVPALYLSLLHMIFVSSIRYRTPAELGLAVLAALVVVRFSQLIGPFKAKCSPAAAPLG